MSAVVAARPVVAARTSKKPKILCVDDEPQIIEAMAANLRQSYAVQMATSGAAGLELLKADPEIVVVISDMRMPAMNGAQFLAKAREVSPDAVRMLLTGQSDLASAIAAINHGGIFRFLTKPCAHADLCAALDAAVVQHRLVTGERVLLEQTLRGAVKALVDVLSLTSPVAFGRANRIKQRVVALTAELGRGEVWQYEVAALLCQLGLVALPAATVDKVQAGHVLGNDELQMVMRVPAITDQLLANIPRIDAVRQILSTHARPPARTIVPDPERMLVELGAHVLRVALDLETPAMGSESPHRVIELLIARGYDPEVVAAVGRLQTAGTEIVVREIPLHALRAGMVLADDVKMANGTLLVAKGYEVTAGFLERIRNFPTNAVGASVRVIGADLGG